MYDYKAGDILLPLMYSDLIIKADRVLVVLSRIAASCSSLWCFSTEALAAAGVRDAPATVNRN